MSESLALLHYPFFVYRGDRKQLWDPIHRRTLKNRPEERVRQRLISCFMHEETYPRSRISTEVPVQLSDAPTSASKRSDILCYDTGFNPQLLVECKAEHVALSEKAATQAAHYNRKIQAPWLLLSNGLADYWYNIEQREVKPEQRPSFIDINDDGNPKNASYWINRGFLGKKIASELAENLTSLLNRHWVKLNQSDPSISYLEFSRHPDHLSLNHYYHISIIQQQPLIRIAIAFTSSKEDITHMICIINQKKENIGFIDINLKFLSESKQENMTVFKARKREHFDAAQQFDLPTPKLSAEQFADLPEKISNWFFRNSEQ